MIDGGVVPTLKHGTEVGEPLKRENINLLGNLENAKSRIVVYFKGMENNEFEYFVPVTIPTIAPIPNVFTALEELRSEERRVGKECRSRRAPEHLITKVVTQMV